MEQNAIFSILCFLRREPLRLLVYSTSPALLDNGEEEPRLPGSKL
jgi:hypothetical protein